jgi:hypothetical protein
MEKKKKNTLEIEDSDIPVHETYVKEEKIKKIKRE